MTSEIPGAIVECGVFKGASFIRFAIFRDLFGNPFSKKLIGFDAFGIFPESGFEPDREMRRRFIEEAGEEGISREQLAGVLKEKGVDKFVELIEGDITKTVPAYLDANPGLKISLLNLDADIYEPSHTVLERLYPRISKGGALILDDYGVFPGETKAVDEYFKDKNLKIRKFPFCMTPCYVVKE